MVVLESDFYSFNYRRTLRISAILGLREQGT